MEPSKLKLDYINEGGKPIIIIDQPKDQELNKELESLFKKKSWDDAEKKWRIQDTKSNRKKLNLAPKEWGERKRKKVPEQNRKAFDDFVNSLYQDNFKSNTAKTYLSEFAQLLTALKSFPVNKLTESQLKNYIYENVSKNKVRERQMNIRLNAVKHFFENVIGKPQVIKDIPRPRQVRSKDKELKNSEIKKMLNTVDNSKHKAVIGLIYLAGLSIPELLSLNKDAVDLSKNKISLKGGNGKVERQIDISPELNKILTEYGSEHKSKKNYLEGRNNKKYSLRSVQALLKNAMERAGISRKVGVHKKKQDYVTELIQCGAQPGFSSMMKEWNMNHKNSKKSKVTKSKKASKTASSNGQLKKKTTTKKSKAKAKEQKG